jgi:vacuolar-type H+-ATPase subunit H
MTTDQMRTADTYVDFSTAPDKILTSAEDEARQIVAKARYEAFRMVTDARAEAEAILDEARPAHQLGGESEPDATDDPESRAAAQDEAAAIIAQAKTTAAEISREIVDGATEQADRILTEARERMTSEQAELVAEHLSLEQKVAGTRSVLETLEERLAAIAATEPAAPPERLAAPATAETTPPARVARPNMIAPGRKAMWASPENVEGAPVAPIDVSAANASDREELIDEPAAPVVLDYAPSVEPVKTASGEAIEENQPAERGSYYSRRSAKLPRLGDSAGHDALGAMKSVRRASE